MRAMPMQVKPARSSVSSMKRRRGRPTCNSAGRVPVGMGVEGFETLQPVAGAATVRAFGEGDLRAARLADRRRQVHHRVAGALRQVERQRLVGLAGNGEGGAVLQHASGIGEGEFFRRPAGRGRATAPSRPMDVGAAVRCVPAADAPGSGPAAGSAGRGGTSPPARPPCRTSSSIPPTAQPAVASARHPCATLLRRLVRKPCRRHCRNHPRTGRATGRAAPCRRPTAASPARRGSRRPCPALTRIPAGASLSSSARAAAWVAASDAT